MDLLRTNRLKNIKSISRVNSDYLLKLLLYNDIDAVLIQEIHAHTPEDLRKKGRIREYDLIGAIYHNFYVVATYTKSNIEHVHLISTRSGNETDNMSIKLEFTINNICKPPDDVTNRFSAN